jgi:PAS domain S-box-containing protein
MPDQVRTQKTTPPLHDWEILAKSPLPFFSATLQGKIVYANQTLAELFGQKHARDLCSAGITDFLRPVDQTWEQMTVRLENGETLRHAKCLLDRKNCGRARISLHAWTVQSAEKPLIHAFCLHECESEQKKDTLKRYAWLIAPAGREVDGSSSHTPCRIQEARYSTGFCGSETIQQAVGPKLLRRVAEECMEMLGSCMSIVERDGSYVLRTCAPPWCALMDDASRSMCETEDNARAMNSGKWLCHESVMSCCRQAMENNEETDMPCFGGLRCLAVPVPAEGKVIGAIAIGYGNPPLAPEVLRTIAWQYRIGENELSRAAHGCNPRPDLLIESMRKRIRTMAVLIGSMVEQKKTQQALQESKEHYEVLVANASQCILVISNGFIVFANPYAEKISGYTAENICGHPIHKFVHPEDQDRVFANFVSRLQGEDLAPYTFRFIARDGTVKKVETTGTRFQWQQREASLIFLTLLENR